MSKNIDQVFIANPITSNASTDLMYFGQSPYSSGADDAAMTYANFSAQFGSPYTAAALTEVSDTNVTLTLGGSPATALLHAASITAGWTGTLSGTRGGTGVNNGANTITLGGSFTTSGAFSSTFTMTNTTSVTFPTSGTLATTSQLPSAAALTKTNDTNVTLTLGGTPSTALLQATSITAGWIGQLGLARGGTNSDLSATGGTSQVLQQVTSGAAITVGQLAASNLSNGVTGTGAVVLANSPTLITPALGTPSSGTLTSCTGLPVAGGGTGNSTFTGYSVICAGTTSTGAFQNVSGVGTTGQVLTSNGASALPTFQSVSGLSLNGSGSLAVNGGSVGSAGAAFAFGSNCDATANYSFAFGDACDATGTYSFAGGNGAGALASYCFAFGNNCDAHNSGSWVTCDSTGTNNNDTGTNQFRVTYTGGFYFHVGSTLALNIDANFNVIDLKGTSDQSYSLQIPTSGFSITIGAGVTRLILNPAGTLTSGTITMPASPIKGQIIKISSSQIVSSLTIQGNSGQSIVSPLLAFTAGQAVSYLYDLASTTWLPTA